MDESGPARTEVVGIAAFGLPGGAEASDGRARRPASWPALLASLTSQGLTGLAVAAAEAGALELSDDEFGQLLANHRVEMLRDLALERRLIAAAGAFGEEGIEVLVLKGPILAHTLYPDPAWRPFVDIDLLVRTRDWRRAGQVLRGLGFERLRPEPRAGFDERFGKAAVYKDRDGLEIDLHRTLALGAFGLWMEPEELFARAGEVEIGGASLSGLDHTGLLLHACLHASLGWMPPLLLPLRDVAQIAHHGDIDWDGLEELSARWRVRGPVAHALSTTKRVLGTVLPREADRLIGVVLARREARVLRAYTTARRRLGGTSLSTLTAIPGVRGKAAYALALALPNRDFLAARAAGRRASYLRRFAVPVRWAVRRLTSRP